MAYLFDPTQDPTRVYVGSDTRMSGLLLGAALATSMAAPLSSAPSPIRGARVVREALAVGGLVTLLWAFVHFDSHAPFLYRGGLVLVDLASCALLAGLAAPTAVARLLGAAPFAWLGRRSYGLYLWHWPIFALTRPDFDLPLNGLPLLALRLTLTVVVSEVCFRLIETPVRRGQLGALLRARPLVFGASAAALTGLAAALIFLSGSRLAAARSANASSSQGMVTAARAVVEANLRAVDGGSPRSAPRAMLGVQLDPTWPETLTLLSDSVGLALSKALPAALPGWKVEVLGRLPRSRRSSRVVPGYFCPNARGVGTVNRRGARVQLRCLEKDRKEDRQDEPAGRRSGDLAQRRKAGLRSEGVRRKESGLAHAACAHR